MEFARQSRRAGFRLQVKAEADLPMSLVELVELDPRIKGPAHAHARARAPARAASTADVWLHCVHQPGGPPSGTSAGRRFS